LSSFLATDQTPPPPTADKPVETFSILAVCTGNVCRSPAVERLLARDLRPSVVVRSAGTHALVGQPIAEPMARLLRDNGVEARAFTARCLTENLVKDADLVLTLTRTQRSLVVELWPPAVRHTFTLRELARLLQQVDPSILPEGTPAERMSAAIPLAVAMRGSRPTSPDDDDVIDPFGRAEEVYAISFGEIAAAVHPIVALLC
jgi:low molecular weight protein-tyrosine phosphatase